MTYINQLSDGSILLTAPVLIPGARDCDYAKGEIPLTEEQVKSFKESYDNYGFVDHEHGLTKNGRKIGEPHTSIILDHDTTFTLYDGTDKTYPTGTWMLTTHLTDDEAISEAMKGYYTGYSPSILPKASADKYLAALKAGKECACKNMVNSSGNALIKDVPDGVVLSVSLTRQPCLHESKFCEIDNMEEDMSLKSKILQAMGMSEEAEVIALAAGNGSGMHHGDTADQRLAGGKTARLGIQHVARHHVLGDLCGKAHDMHVIGARKMLFKGKAQ